MVFAAGAALGGAAFGAGGAAARAGIVVGARLRAVERFKALSAAIAGSNNALVRFGRQGLIASGQIAVFSAAMKLLVNPISGLLALLEVGLATRNWLIFERATRRAQVQLRLMNLTVGQSNERINTFRRILGATTAAELFNSERAFVELNKVSGDWRTTITEIGADLKLKTGVDIGAFTSAASSAVLGLQSGVTDLKALFPALDIQELTDGQAILELIGEAVAAEDVTNMEQFNFEIQKLQDTASGPIGSLTDALAEVPSEGAQAANAVIDFFSDFVSAADASIEPVDNALTTFFKDVTDLGSDKTLGETWKTITDQWSVDMEAWKDEFVPVWLGKTAQAVGTLSGGVITQMQDTFGSGGSVEQILNDFQSTVWDTFWNQLSVPSFDFNFESNISGPAGEFPRRIDNGVGARGSAVLAARNVESGSTATGAPEAINVYIGEKKVDTVVLDSLTRTARFRSGVGARSMYS